MNEAVRFAKEIVRKRRAICKTKSETLRRDYEKSIQRDMRELIFYVRCYSLNIKEVFEKALEEAQ